VTTTGTLVYVHGASDRPAGVAHHVALIEGQLHELGRPFRVIASQWGEAAGARLDRIELAVPRADPRLDVAGPTDPMREMVTGDPLAGLRSLAGTSVAPPSAGSGARASDSLLAIAQLADPDLREAARAITASEEYRRARDGGATELELVTATARAIAALAATASEGGSGLGVIEHRMALARSVEERLAQAVLAVAVGVLLAGYGGLDLGPDVRRWATDTVIPHRVSLMRGVLPGPADILVYLHAGAAIRRFVRRTLEEAAAARPVIALGSSLGAVILFDALREDASAMPDLLVTVGSQSPLLEVIGALEDGGPNPPYQPWLNVYDRRDLLGFVAQPVWPEHTGIVDAEVDLGVGFPDSHGQTYLAEPQVYRAIRARLEELDRQVTRPIRPVRSRRST
jgi:hypothetical protein